MAATTLPEALKRSKNPIIKSIAKEIIVTDALGAIIPFTMLEGTDVPVAREGSLPVGGAFLPDSGVTTENSTGTDDVIKVPMRRIVGNFDVDMLAEMASPPQPGGSHIAAQLTKKIKATWLGLTAKLVTGAQVTGFEVSGAAASPGLAVDAVDPGPWLDSKRRGPGSLKYTHVGTFWQFRAPGDVEYGPQVAAAADGTILLKSHNPSYWIRVTLDVSDATADGECLIRFTSSSNEFDGMQELVHPDRLIDPEGADGDAFSVAMLDRMITNEKIRTNRAFILPSQLIERYKHICRSFGGMSPPMMKIPGYGANREGTVLEYNGIPLLESENVPTTETVGITADCTSIYLASLDEVEGLSLGASNGSQSFVVDGDPRERTVLGWYLVNVGALEGADHIRTRLGWLGAPKLGSTRALVRRRGVKTTYA